MRQLAFWIFFFIVANSLHAQENDLEYFIAKAEENVPILLENENLQKIGALQNDMIHAQNNAFQVGTSSDILIAPYFNNNGKLLDITTMPSANAIGYDVGITNGGLYSAQVNVTRNLFNKAIVDNLLFQNKMGIEALQLTSEEIKNQLGKNVTDTYILAYQIYREYHRGPRKKIECGGTIGQTGHSAGKRLFVTSGRFGKQKIGTGPIA